MIIPIFIPHEGCPHLCLFCNQRKISGFAGQPVSAEEVQAEIQTWLTRKNLGSRRVQVAFYGGSFTALPKLRQRELLTAVAPFLEQQVQSVRLSTRPDYMDLEQAEFLKAHKVATVELGVQSMNDHVLAAAQRGHTAADAEQAMAVLRQAGMEEIGIQLMLGLPEDSRASLRRTVERVIALRPDFIRIYPLVVVKNSGLADLHKQGRYTPLSLDKAVILAAFMKERFERAGIRVVRMGLQAGAELEAALLAGPWHPAFGELVSSRLMLRQTKKMLAQALPDSLVCLRISSRDQSVFRGMKSANIRRLEQLGLWRRIILRTDPEQERGSIRNFELVIG